MRRLTLISLALSVIGFQAAFAQTASENALALAQKLRTEQSRYAASHPTSREQSVLIRLLEKQAALLQQPATERDPAAVAAQKNELSAQIDVLEKRIANYKPSHPDVERTKVLIAALAEERKQLDQ